MADEPFEGVEINSPLGKVRIGRGRSQDVEADEEYWRVRRRVRRVLRFYRHLVTFVAVNLLLFLIDFISSREEFFVQWVALVWGAILALHFLNTFVFSALLGSDAERHMIDKEMQKREAGGPRST